MRGNYTYISLYPFVTFLMKPRNSFAFLSFRCPLSLSIDIIFDVPRGVLKRCMPSAVQNSAPCYKHVCLEALGRTSVIQRTQKKE